MNGIENAIAAFAGLGVAAWFIIILVSTAISVINYYLYCVPQEKIAAKMNAGSTWMAYVPFARNVQRMKMANMPTWKLLFVGSTFTVAFSMLVIFLVSLIFIAINGLLGTIICSLLIIVYLVFYIIETYRYNLIIADTFGFDKPLALVWMFVPVVGQVITYLIALSNRIQPKGKSAPRATGAAPKDSSIPAAPQVNGLEGVAGMYSGAQFKMSANEEFMIGRDGTLSDIVISTNSEKVSRRHCSVKYLASLNCYQVTDYSLNGTFYGNSRLVKDQPTQLPRGTTIVIGDKYNQFKLM